MGTITGRFPDENNNPILRTIRDLACFDLEKGPWVAGGALRRIFGGDWEYQGDIDIFLSDRTKAITFPFVAFPGRVSEPEPDLAETLMASLRSRWNFTTETRQGSTTNFSIGGRRLQVVARRTYECVADLLEDIDFTVCMAATDGWNWIADERMFTDLAAKRLAFGTANPRTNAFRLVKYCAYGFTPEPGVLAKTLQIDAPGCGEIITEEGKISAHLQY